MQKAGPILSISNYIIVSSLVWHYIKSSMLRIPTENIMKLDFGIFILVIPENVFCMNNDCMSLGIPLL